MNLSPASLVQGSTPVMTDVLLDANGAPVDLTGATVVFVYQGGGNVVCQSRPATITDALAGAVAYQFQPDETNALGIYLAQWQVTFADNTQQIFPPATGVFQATRDNVLMKWPDGTWHAVERKLVEGQWIWDVEQTPTSIGGWEEFSIVIGSDVTPVCNLFEPIRALAGDLHPTEHLYEDATLASVVRSVVALGKLNVMGTLYTLTPDRRAITPALPDARTLALGVLHSVKYLLRPNMAGSSYRTRAISESFGNQRDFLWDLNNEIWDMENPNGACATFQNFYGWVNATTGLNIYALMTDMNTTGSVATVSIGRAGLQVNANL